MSALPRDRIYTDNRQYPSPMYENTRPYDDAEVPEVIRFMASHAGFPLMVKLSHPDTTADAYREEFLKIKTVREFQQTMSIPFLNLVLANTSKGVSVRGLDLLDGETCRMYIGNHRDIVLDAAILMKTLAEHGMDTPEITFGSNLMQGDLVTAIGKINKMFRIVRGGNIRDFYKNSIEVSGYMRHALLEKKQSVWIAQRNGRTKDGDDHTELGVLKMFALSSKKPFVENIEELCITPLSVSYEYEPCDFLKTQELFVSRYQQYIKSEGEDMASIMQGVNQPKGRITLTVCPAITREELEECDAFDKNDKYLQLAHIIDRRIFAGYQLYPTNYVAHDLLSGRNRWKHRYTATERAEFEDYMMRGLSALKGDADELREIFLGIYARPVDNCAV